MVQESLRRMLYGAQQDKRAEADYRTALDSAKSEAFDSAAKYELMSARMDAAAAIKQWAEDDDLDEGETSADRLQALLVGIANSNMDGELDEDEQEIMIAASEAAWDYLAAFGVDEEDLDALLNDWDADTAVRIQELLAGEMDNEDDDEMDSFVFGPEAQEAVFDATYKKRTVIRGGKKVRVNKRVTGKVRLSGKQKMSLRKAQLKSRSAGAKMRRIKSMRKGVKMGLGK